MTEEKKSQEHSGAEKAEVSPLETLTSLVLDAADAANDSAQVTSHRIYVYIYIHIYIHIYIYMYMCGFPL